MLFRHILRGAYIAQSCRLKSSMPVPNSSSYYVTTPLFYVNAEPHIGHLYSALIADVAARWKRLRHPDAPVLLSTGTDEHGIKVQQAAESVGLIPLVHSTNISQRFRSVFDRFDVNYTSFVRTTSTAHKKAVQHLWTLLESNGYIYRSKYSGWYSIVDETFYRENEIITKSDAAGNSVKVAASTGSSVQWTEEENYMFRLSLFVKPLREWLETKDPIYPSHYVPYLLNIIGDQLNDISVSRPASRMYWGIDVPSDPYQKIYVWFDALTNYLTVVGFPETLGGWPPTVHVIGKDIINFHAIYWAAFLMAAKLPLPQKICCHGHWLIDDVKMSKSLGNVVDPNVASDLFTVDGLRYFLIRHATIVDDSNYTEKKIRALLKNELADVLGNLLKRSTQPKLNPTQQYPPFHSRIFEERCQGYGLPLLETLKTIAGSTAEAYEAFQYYRAVTIVINCLRQTNAFYQHCEPWKLTSGSEAESQLRDTINRVTYESLRICSVLLLPVIPRLTAKVLTRLSVPCEEWTFEHCLPVLQDSFSSFAKRQLGPDCGDLFDWKVLFKGFENDLV